MASCFIERRSTGRGMRYRVRFRLGGRESKVRTAGASAPCVRHAFGATGSEAN